MQTTQLIAQVALMVFVTVTLFQIIRKRKKERSTFNLRAKIIATVILFVWLFFAGAFDRLISPMGFPFF